MQSRISQSASKALIALCKRMTPQQRLAAFLHQSRLMSELFQAGRKSRARHRGKRRVPPSSAP